MCVSTRRRLQILEQAVWSSPLVNMASACEEDGRYVCLTNQKRMCEVCVSWEPVGCANARLAATGGKTSLICVLLFFIFSFPGYFKKQSNPAVANLLKSVRFASAQYYLAKILEMPYRTRRISLNKACLKTKRSN